MTALISTVTSCRNEKSTNISRNINIKHHQVLLLFTNQDSGFQSDQCGVIVQHRTHRFRIRDSAGFTVPSTSVPSTSVWPNRELLSSSSLPRKKQSHSNPFRFLNIFLNPRIVSYCCSRNDVGKKYLLLHSLLGIPSILALMSFLFFLMAERTASKRKPGHLSSFSISLQTHTVLSACRQLHWHHDHQLKLEHMHPNKKTHL